MTKPHDPAIPTADFAEFVLIWNARQGLGMPALHLNMTRWLASRWDAGVRELLLLAFRDSGKSTLVGLFCAWMLHRDPSKRILVLAADFALAKKMVRNVKRIIERHPLTKGLKPHRKDQWAADQFTVNRAAELRDPSMLAKGIGANVTGSRADVVICDDVEVPNTCDSITKRSDLRERLSEIDYVLVPGGLQLYVGTPHTYWTIYSDRLRPETGEEMPFLDGFSRLELPVVDGQGQSRWPERFPPAKIDSIRKRSGRNKFESQMMLRPLNITEGRLDPDKLGRYTDDLVYGEHNGKTRLTLGGVRLVSASCWWDPAYGAPDKGDASVVAVVFTSEVGDARLHAVRYLTHDPSQLDQVDEATQQCQQVVAFAKAHYVPSVTVESNGIGRFLPGLLRREFARAGLSCAVVEAHSRRNKDQRILDAFDDRMAAGNLSAHAGVFATPFVTEMREWRPGIAGADDGLDAVAGCLGAEPVRMPDRHPVANARRLGDWAGAGGGFRAVTDFAV